VQECVVSVPRPVEVRVRPADAIVAGPTACLAWDLRGAEVVELRLPDAGGDPVNARVGRAGGEQARLSGGQELRLAVDADPRPGIENSVHLPLEQIRAVDHQLRTEPPPARAGEEARRVFREAGLSH